ncbi:MAG: hypothetical protein HOE11_02755 [Candidatus Diapherotrites archaeon]|nr:hypothetical protein [Candidatus Diapherotrites archaeon]MBT4597088.1 hypothetical protein [Candidatus Diapherotrites archaeon]
MIHRKLRPGGKLSVIVDSANFGADGLMNLNYALTQTNFSHVTIRPLREGEYSRSAYTRFAKAKQVPLFKIIAIK